MALLGIDVSRHQGTIDWRKVASAGHTFAFCKATDGTSYAYTDYYRQQIAGIIAAGLVPGAYHWLRAGPRGESRDPRGQARYFVDVVKPRPGLLCALDVEVLRNSAGDVVSLPGADDAHEFADEFARLTGGHPLFVYSGKWYWDGMIGNPHGADIGPLWHSEYETTDVEIGDGPELDSYGGWSAATLWQYTSSGSCPGVEGSCDLNLFYGNRAALDALAGVKGDWFDMATKEDLEAVVRASEARIIQQVIGNKPLVVAFDDVVPGQPDHWFLLDGIERIEVTKDEAAQRVAEGTARWWNGPFLPLRIPRATLEAVPQVDAGG